MKITGAMWRYDIAGRDAEFSPMFSVLKQGRSLISVNSVYDSRMLFTAQGVHEISHIVC